MKAKEKIGPVPFVLIAAAVALIVAGTLSGEAQLVLTKAVNICMSCISASLILPSGFTRNVPR